MSDYHHLEGTDIASQTSETLDVQSICLSPLVVVYGSFAGTTFDIKVSVDGTNFELYVDANGNVYENLTSSGAYPVPNCREVQIDVTTYGTGTLSWKVGGIKRLIR